jgi:hypothetical protein
MATITIQGFVHKQENSDKMIFWPSDMSEYGYTMVGPHEFQYKIPSDFNPVAAEVAMLDKKLADIKNEYADRVRVIEDRKARLLCIENNPTESA